MVPLLRDALVEVYFKAAKARELSRATKRQISNANSALNSLTRAIDYLERVSTDGGAVCACSWKAPLWTMKKEKEK